LRGTLLSARLFVGEFPEPIGIGKTARDLSMEGGKIYEWAGDTFAAGDVFTHVVDLDDIAPFCEFPDPVAYFKMEDPRPGWDHWPRNMVNGFTTADSWKYVLSINLEKGQPTRFTLTLPREETVTEVSVVFNALYHRVTRFRLTFDGAESALTLDAAPGNERQDFPVRPPRRAKAVTVELLEWTKEARAPVVGVDKLWIRVERPEAFRKKVVPLLNIGALVKYPMGEGGVVLNELRIAEEKDSPNALKRRNIVATILRSLGAVFEAE
jgi:hypothetical protein